jgi:hypothetical protein
MDRRPISSSRVTLLSQVAAAFGPIDQHQLQRDFIIVRGS